MPSSSQTEQTDQPSQPEASSADHATAPQATTTRRASSSASLLSSTAPPSECPPHDYQQHHHHASTTAAAATSSSSPPAAKSDGTQEEGEPVFFFDVDNTLYHYSTGIADLMVKRIHQYCESIGIEKDKIEELAHRYYIDYGLAIRGLILHHDVDPVDYDKKVDCSLPLEMILSHDLELRKMLTDLKMKRWIFTNAGKTHASRVVRILGIDDLFDGMTYCDYSEPNFPCKPERTIYERAMKDAGAKGKCYFVDDSVKNIVTAASLGWTAVHVTDEPDHGHVNASVPSLRVRKVHDLPKVLPELWRDGEE